MTNFDLANQKTYIPCPACKRQVTITLQQAAGGQTVHCTCGQPIKLVDDKGSTRKGIQDVKKSMKGLENAFKKLGKK